MMTHTLVSTTMYLMDCGAHFQTMITKNHCSEMHTPGLEPGWHGWEPCIITARSRVLNNDEFDIAVCNQHQETDLLIHGRPFSDS